jgi:hypothetical protein
VILFNFSTNPMGGGRYHAQNFLDTIFEFIDKKNAL